METDASRIDWVGRDIHDGMGGRIGSVVGVVLEPTTGLPWAAINLVRFGERLTFMPAHEVWSADGQLLCEIPRETVRSAPMASHRGRIEHVSYRALLHRHYGTATCVRAWPRPAPGPRSPAILAAA